MRVDKVFVKKEIPQLPWDHPKRNTSQIPWDGGSINFIKIVSRMN